MCKFSGLLNVLYNSYLLRHYAKAVVLILRLKNSLYCFFLK